MNKSLSSLLLIISAPSGCGKTTLLGKVMANIPGLGFSISHTTRAPRAGEVDGVDYHFVSHEEFIALRDHTGNAEDTEQRNRGFLEWAEVHDNLYGTSWQSIYDQQEKGTDVILDIDVQGARQVQKQAESVSIFIVPPSMEELERRLRRRGTESEETLSLRLANAAEELEAVDDYDYLIVNDDLNTAVETMQGIILAERSKQRRDPDGQPLSVQILS